MSGRKKMVKTMKGVIQFPSAPTDHFAEKIAFSFQYMTTNNQYSIDRIAKMDVREQQRWLSALFEKLKDLCNLTWTQAYGERKQTGLETLPADRIQFEPSNYKFTSDEKVIITRFHKQSGRILGVKKKDSNVFYIIGFDFDFSAYQH